MDGLLLPSRVISRGFTYVHVQVQVQSCSTTVQRHREGPGHTTKNAQTQTTDQRIRQQHGRRHHTAAQGTQREAAPHRSHKGSRGTGTQPVPRPHYCIGITRIIILYIYV